MRTDVQLVMALVGIAIWFLAVGGMLFVAVHFISKFW